MPNPTNKRMKQLIVAVTFIACQLANSAQAKLYPTQLDKTVGKVEKTVSGTLGVAACDKLTGDTWFLNGDKPFLMQSVAKLPIAIAVLKEIDNKKLALDTAVSVTRSEVMEIRHGAIPDNLPVTTKTCTPLSLIKKSICQSNNGAADVLTRLAGGPAAVTKMLKTSKIDGIRIDRYEREIVKPGADQSTLDTATPTAICHLLVKLGQGKLLSDSSTELLLNLMSHSQTGKNRIPAGFPSQFVVAHKTGTGRTTGGVSVATNDVGIVTRPDGDQMIVAIFLANAKGSEKQRDAVIAKVSKAISEAWKD